MNQKRLERFEHIAGFICHEAGGDIALADIASEELSELTDYVSPRQLRIALNDMVKLGLMLRLNNGSYGCVCRYHNPPTPATDLAEFDEAVERDHS